MLEQDKTFSLQTETQKYVSEIQAYNGMLQSAPGIVFTLFAGPLTDSFGRKPLIISALFGYLLLDIIFLVNAYWFFELKVVLVPVAFLIACHSISATCAQVEYLLLECLQDLTGGATCFYLASYSYMADITTPDTRIELQTKVNTKTCNNEPLLRAFSWLKAANIAFTFKNLLRTLC